MNILNELNNRNIAIIQSKKLYKGYYTTPKGIVVSFNPSKCEKGIYFLENEKGKVLPITEQTVYVSSGTEYEGKLKSIEESAILAKKGKILAFKASDLYAEYYDIKNDADLECCLRYGYSAKSREYIENVMKEIGMLRYTEGSNGSFSEDGVPTDFDVVVRYDPFFNAETEIGKFDTYTWIAQTCFMIEIDDFAVVKMYFNHCPTLEELRKAFAIRTFERKPVEIFTCWECGHSVHWLELCGDICQRVDMVAEKYCGC